MDGDRLVMGSGRAHAEMAPPDGHHKREAAATAARPVRLLSLLALGESLAGAEGCARLPALRARPRSARAAGT
ncbi:hypothetical protein ACGFNX_21875 [Streptomyces sp. NPDC048723]|uniref:hypothetical protein n=1 Tax=Streptomyces sp. NPDC048723 TaxID=3365589 RepID=UPI0037113E37